MCFGEYGIAMTRKLAMAEYHYGELRQAPTEPDEDGLPPIPLQAPFEAAGRAVASMPDQMASGLVEILGETVPGLPGMSRAYLHTVLDGLPESDLRRLLVEFTEDVRYEDLWAWRNRVTHRFDRKAAMDGVWIVEPPEGCEPWVEPRDVEAYILTMLDFGRLLLRRACEAENLAFQLRDDVLAGPV